jgi:hypothetical protein
MGRRRRWRASRVCRLSGGVATPQIGPPHPRLRHRHDVIVMDIVNDHMIVPKRQKIAPHFDDLVMRTFRHARIGSEIDQIAYSCLHLDSFPYIFGVPLNIVIARSVFISFGRPLLTPG